MRETYYVWPLRVQQVLLLAIIFVLLDLELDISHMYIEEVLLKYILIFDLDLRPTFENK